MHCPNCVDQQLRPVLTKQGVEIDCCDECQGIWLDKGEIFYFTKWRKELAKTLQEAKKNCKPSARVSPKTGSAMQEISFLAGRLNVDMCPDTEGLWFDEGEINKLTLANTRIFSIQKDDTAIESIKQSDDDEKVKSKIAPPTLQGLPNLAVRSTITLISLYALVTFVLILCVEFAGLSPTWAVGIGIGIAAIQFLAGPWLMDISLSWFYNMQWVQIEELPAHLKRFVTSLCKRKTMEIPRFGIINDGGPNAFTYGHTPNNARVVITKGILNLLDEDEVEAVVAHEIGHAKNWDMLWMTVVQMVPLILYYVYRTLIGSEKRSKNRKGSGQLALIAIVAYLFYIISEYIVLWFSRTREYYADRFAGQVTGNPNSLSSALVKIAYGLAGNEKKEKKGKKEARSSRLEAISALGIFDTGMSRSFAVSAYTAGGGSADVMDLSKRSNILGAMKWDLWNPWALYYELHSTHPLVAKRMSYLSNQAEAMGQEPFIRFTIKKPESYWDEFVADIFILFMPFLAFCVLTLTAIITQKLWMINLAIVAMGILAFIKLHFTYPADMFPQFNISGLLKKVKVSGVRAVPCKLQGRVIGRGVPGLIWSEDFIIQDNTGIIFLDYRQPLRIWEFFFGLMRSKELQNTDVEIEGWYRRSPVPYIELKTLKTAKKTNHCYVYTLKRIFAVLTVIAGLLLPISNYDTVSQTVSKEVLTSLQTTQKNTPQLQAHQHIKVGYNFYKQGDFSRALAEYNQAIENDPNNNKAFYYRGAALLKTGQNDQALSDFKQSIELDPRHFESYLYLDWLLTRQSQWDTIISYWSDFIQLEPEHARAYLERGGAYYHQGNRDAALRDAKKSCELGNSEGCRRYKQLKQKMKSSLDPGRTSKLLCNHSLSLRNHKI